MTSMPYRKSQMRKGFTYSTPANAATVNNYLRIYAAATGQPESVTIEDCLLAQILPADRDASYFVQELLTSEDPEMLGRAMYRIMALLAVCDSDWISLYPNGKPMVELFQHFLWQSVAPISGSEKEWIHLGQQWGTIVELISFTQDNVDKLDKYGAELQDCIENEAYRSPELVTNCVSYILTHWDAVGHHSRTYRALADLALLARPKNTPANQLAYIDTLRKISASWSR